VNKDSLSKNRRYPRVAMPKGMMVAWQAKSERVVSAVTTIGLGGLFVSTPRPPAVGETVRLILCVPNGDVRAVAVVRDSQAGRGMGLQFIAMRHDDRARLQQLLRRLIPEQIPSTAHIGS
jgi:Tfp pilus assembly protein PilZ